MVKKNDLENLLMEMTGNIQIIVNKNYDYISVKKTNVVTGELVCISLNYDDEHNIVMIEFTFDDGNIICEDFNLNSLEINKDDYVSEGIISLIDNSSEKEIHIQE